MNIEQYKQLEPYEEHLYTSYKLDYYRNLSVKSQSDLALIFKEMYREESKIGKGCNSCVLKDLKRLGKDYFEYKNNNMPQPIPEEVQNVEPEEQPKPKKSNGSKKTTGK